MKRQKIRKALIFILFLLFPVVMFYLSPVLIIEGASQGVITGEFRRFFPNFCFLPFSRQSLLLLVVPWRRPSRSLF